MSVKKTSLHEPKHPRVKAAAYRIVRRGDLYSVEMKVGTAWVPIEQNDSLARAELMHARLSQPLTVVTDAEKT